MRGVWSVCLLASMAAASSCVDDETVSGATLVLRGGEVVTLDERRPSGTAVAIDGRTIEHVGSDDEIAAYIGPETRVIELDGALVIPGFVESHAHLLKLGIKQASLPIDEAETWDEIAHMVAEVAETTPAGEWIFGRGWHQEKWAAAPLPSVQGFPVHDALSRVAPNHPVLLTHANGHVSIANQAAMERAGVTASTPDPEGGELLRQEDGSLAGIFVETAERLIESAYAADRARRGADEVKAEREQFIEAAIEECLRNGVTSFHDAGSSFEMLDLYRELAESDRLRLRLYVMVMDTTERMADKLAGYRMVSDRLTIRSIKRTIDGALGARGAWLLEPYHDRPDSHGEQTEPLHDLVQVARLALEHDYQLAIHAIGDRANREVLDLYENAFEFAEPADRRWRIEHAQHLHPDDVPRFARLDVIASMQTVHGTSDGPWVPERLGIKRSLEGAYVWRSLLDSGARICNGTDAPVEPIDPIANFHAAVTRQTADGSTFFPDQAMTRQEALHSMTLEGAFAGFAEDRTGSISPGKLADLVVLSRNILEVGADEIRGARVRFTIVDGEVAYAGHAD